jgi:hypothetical protein
MMGNLVRPLIATVMSSLAETMAEQQEAVDSLMRTAQRCLESDAAVVRLLGKPLRVDAPFSQSSASTTINGLTTTRIELAFQVSGSLQSGVARLTSTGKGSIAQLQLQTNDGRVLAVQTTSTGGKRPSSSLSRGGVDGDDNNIIEAEIVEKKKSKL